MTAAAPLDLSIVLVNWNACALTAAALDSIAVQTSGITYETFVIDNGSTRDASFQELPRRFPSVQFIPNPRNMGFSVANNQGITRAHGRYILLLNNDTIQTENALAASVQYMDEHAEVGGLGILHRNADAERSLQLSAFAFPRPWREMASLLGVPWTAPAFRHDVEGDVDWICGSFLMIRRACLDQVGGLDERFFVYAEDVDWCRRARDAGWKIRFWPGASMVHVGAATRPFIKDKTFVHFRSHLSYIRKYHSSLAAAAYYLVMVARLTGATLAQTMRWMVGRASLADVRERSSRQLQFALLRPGREGV
jgi:GT2 family glycosyltransferase